ncbi:MAG TPA: hypothetical protein VF847_03515, partial [Candidatus Deferrimicrobiaceae bacterium]
VLPARRAGTEVRAMRKRWILGMVGVLALFLAGCGGNDGPTTVVIQTLSAQGVDGDIGLTPGGTFLISQANNTQNVLFGLDSDGTEFRAFLDFPLDGSNGGGVVPLGATIISADIEIFVNNLSFASTVPTLLDLVPFPVTGLTSTDYNSAPLLTRSPFDLFRSDVNNFVRIDVTSLMVEAQRLGFRNLQLRFLLDFVPGAAGLVELNDGPESNAPLLTVQYQ